MDFEELLAEGKRLAKECCYLMPEGPPDRLAAIWYGREGEADEESGRKHLMTVATDFIPELPEGLSGSLKVYLRPSDDPAAGVEVDSLLTDLKSVAGGRPLYAERGISYPSLETLFRVGSERIKSAVAEDGMWPDMPAADCIDGGSSYEDVTESQSPLFDETAVAMLGGWNPRILAPSEYDSQLANWKFVACTFGDEPWVEVWWDGSKLVTVERIT